MEIIIAGKRELCYGARRALKIARKTRRREGSVSARDDRIYNPRVIISRPILPPACFIENADPIKPRMLHGAKTIGISGGASAPPEAIEAAVRKIQRNFEQHHHEESRPQ